MGFPGKDQMAKDSPGGGGWIKLVDDQPQTVTILGYVGPVQSKKFPEKTQYRFDATDAQGQAKHLDCNWRLMKALREQAELLDSAYIVTITQTKVIAEIAGPDGVKKKSMVNQYALKDVKAVYVSPEAPF